MKKHAVIILSAVAMASLLFQSCLKDSCSVERVYTDYEAIYAPMDEMRNAVSAQSAHVLEKTGKIYLWGNHILINEPNKGIHIIDNSDPAHPKKIAFLNIPGNIDMAMKGSILYADNYIDLVVFDMSNPSAPVFVDRIKDVFPQYDKYGNVLTYDAAKGIVAEWKPVEKREKIKTDCNVTMIFDDMPFVTTNESGVFTSGSGAGGRVPGTNASVGGSMARFTVKDDQLYTVDYQDLHVFNISTPTAPAEQSLLSIGANIETIWPYDNHLYIGAQDGMHIYQLDNPAVPVYVSTYNHITSCDPVVVQGNTAFVTLRTGTGCGNNMVNTLDVIDLTDKSNPMMINSYGMTNPNGLGVDGSMLFLCDNGLKVFDISDLNQITNHQLMERSDITAYDVIPYAGRLLVIGDDGLYQYSYTATGINYVSVLPTGF